MEDGRLAPTTPIAALVASGLVLSFSLNLMNLLTVAFAILVGDDDLGAFFSACNLWCSHDSLRPLSEPYRAGFEMIKQYCSRFFS
uniref:Uncharacterized protein n=1 Tax=Helianthus annuus TaxID=4232 RepID=A0A251VDS5_HELAN